eukprot:Nitzschia sp. Nitz4//scaffold52_size167869//33017//33694//NITZ4_002264-RA/size167869-processed-gene-0.153-mRNA-1//-1//CDS//3329553999//1755//frame0
MRIAPNSSQYSMISLKSQKRKHSGDESGGESDDSTEIFLPHKKRVRFETGQGDSVRTYEKELEIHRSDLDKSKMWWSRKERGDITEECHEAIDEFRQCHLEQVRHFNSVFDQCKEPLSHASSETLEKVTISLPDHVRGLEWGWSPSTISHRQEHVKEIVAVHQQIRSLKPNLRDQVLSTRSQRSSRPGRVLARLLGEGDEKQVKEENDVLKQGRRSPCRMMPSFA